MSAFSKVQLNFASAIGPGVISRQSVELAATVTPSPKHERFSVGKRAVRKELLDNVLVQICLTGSYRQASLAQHQAEHSWSDHSDCTKDCRERSTYPTAVCLDTPDGTPDSRCGARIFGI